LGCEFCSHRGELKLKERVKAKRKYQSPHVCFCYVHVPKMKRGGILAITGLLAGISCARPSPSSGAIHPFAKYKDLVAEDNARSAPTTTTSAPTPTRAPLECFQVAEPVLTPSGVTRRDITVDLLPPSNQQPIEVDDDAAGLGNRKACAVVLMEHTFANSYGAPFVGMDLNFI